MDESKRTKFLSALAKTGNVSRSAQLARIGRSSVYALRSEDQDFAKQWDEAIEVAGDLLEEEARRRAVTGWLKPVFQGGVQVGTVREYSDALLILLLKAAKPAKYRENHNVEVQGSIGLPVIREIIVERPSPAEEDEDADAGGSWRLPQG